MPTPLFYRGVLYVLANNGVFDAYDPVTGTEIYRQRLPLVGSGFSASPIAADGKIYLTNEDGEILVVEAGPAFTLIATNSMGKRHGTRHVARRDVRSRSATRCFGRRMRRLGFCAAG